MLCTSAVTSLHLNHVVKKHRIVVVMLIFFPYSFLFSIDFADMEEECYTKHIIPCNIEIGVTCQ